MGTWGLAQAKAQLSEMVHQAEHDGPQVITRSGREVALVVSIADWNKLKGDNGKNAVVAESKGSLADFLLNSPLRGSEVEFPRMRGKTRPVQF